MNVAITCHCDIGMLKKYIKIDDFNYEEVENLHSADEIYYGYEVRLDLLQVTTGFIVFIPGYGRFPWGIAYEYIDDDIELFLLGIEGPLKIPEDSMIIFNLREKFECVSTNENFKPKKSRPVKIAFYSLSNDDVNEDQHTLGTQPKFLNVGELEKELANVSYRLVFNCNESENEAHFREKLSEAVFKDLGLRKYTVKGLANEFFISKPLEAEFIRSFSKSQRESICVAELTVLMIDKPFVNENNLSAAMLRTFERADRIYLPFQNFVLEAATRPENRIIVRLFHLAQSSGTGKTKLCLHLIKELNRGIYCVYRPDDSSGFPRSNSWTSEFIRQYKETTSDEKAVELCLVFIWAAINSFFSYNVDPVNFSSNPKKTLFKPLIESFNNNLNAARNKSAETLIAEIISLSFNIEVGSCFPIVLDECQEFLIFPDAELGSNRISLYRAFRRAMIKVKDAKVVVICLGTKSSLNDFVLNYRIDASARPDDDIRPISPYIFVHSFDVFLSGDIKLSYSKLIESPEQIKKIGIACGRPLWKTFGNYIKAFDAAKSKLAADAEIARLTAFVLRTGAPVVPSCELSHKLVLSGMALLQYVDVFGKSCEVSYCPEPVLSSAARLYAGSLDNLNLSLKQFLEYVDKRSVLDLGSTGEFIARIILLRAIDHLAENSSASLCSAEQSIDDKWISEVSQGLKPMIPEKIQKFPNYALFTLREFLISLGNLSVDELNDLNLSNEMLDGLVNVSQFITVKRPFMCDQLDLLHGFVRSIGYCLPTNWPGADLMIPVFRSDNRFSCIMVQVKNLDQLSIPGAGTKLSDEIINKMTHDYIKLNLSAKGDFYAVPENEFVKIVIQFAEPRTNKPGSRTEDLKKIVPSANGKDRVLWILGMEGFKHLFTANGAEAELRNGGIINDLETILSGARDYIDRIKSHSIVLQSSQNEREGIRTLLNTCVPILTSEYLSLHDPTFKAYYPNAFSKIEMRVKVHKLSHQLNNMQIKYDGMQTSESDRESATESAPESATESEIKSESELVTENSETALLKRPVSSLPNDEQESSIKRSHNTN